MVGLVSLVFLALAMMINDPTLRPGDWNKPGITLGPAASSAPAAVNAVQTLAQLPVRPRSWAQGFDRNNFNGYDFDHNGCETKSDLLARDLSDERVRSDCSVTYGVLNDRYNGVSIELNRGRISVDHVVSLSDAWQKGGERWDQIKLQSFGNDPLNLIVTQTPTNQDKGNLDASQWLPPDASYRCGFVTSQIAIKRQ